MQASTAHDSPGEAGFWLATIEASPQLRQRTLIMMGLLLVAFVAAASFAPVRLVESDGFIPIVQAIIFITDLITAVLLFKQFALVRSRALLVLASAYLFTSLIVIPHTLTFPRVFAPQGLFGGGLQVTGWLHIIWHFGFPAAVIGYVLMKDAAVAKHAPQASTASAIFWSAATVVGVVCATTWGLVAAGPLLPRLFLDRVTFSPLVFYTGLFDLTVCGIALLLLGIRQRSVLDQWLMIAICATFLEMAMVTFFSAGRFDLGWYSVRFFSVIASTIVLIALLTETLQLYAGLALAVGTLKRERDSRLVNIDAVLASIAHEVKQPLTAVTTNGAAARRWLQRQPPDIAEAQQNLDEMIDAGFRVSAVFDDIRALFRSGEQHEAVNLNDLVLGVVAALDRDMQKHRISAVEELSPELPPVAGNKGQLHQVVLNLVQNAIDAMTTVEDGHRLLRLRTEYNARPATVTLTIEDSGPGIDPQMTDHIFDAFVTTKANGMGIGLAISRMIIEHHAGEIRVSSNPGLGAKFRVTLPVNKVPT